MKNNLSSLLRKIFLGSLAGIAASNTNAANKTIIEPTSNDVENKIVSIFKNKIDLTPKLLLKKNSSNELFAMAHRSHRSHQSHRSHYSSSGGGGGGTYTPPSNSNSPGNGGLSPGSKSNSGSSNGITTTTLRLGSRTLKKGMSGTDVTELVNILLRKQYLKLDGGGTQVTGEYTFDSIVEGAIKKFQTDNGLTSDGECGSTTIYYLKNK